MAHDKNSNLHFPGKYTTPPNRQPIAMFDGQAHSSLIHLKQAPPCFRFVEMPVRRHIQNPKYSILKGDIEMQNKNVKKVSLVNSNKIPSEGFCLIEWYTSIWTDAQKNEFLHKLLLKLDPQEHYFISTTMVVKKYRDFIAYLPENVSLKILTYLKPRRIVICSLVSKAWYKICNNNDLWKVKCARIQLQVPLRNNQLTTWKEIFKENLMVKKNWSLGRCNVINCAGHDNRVLCATFQGQRMATGSADKTIKIWDLRSGKCIQTLTGHLKGIWYLKYYTSTLLLSCSYDSTIKIWNLNDCKCSRTLIGHEGPVWAITNQGNIMISASQDKTAKVWNLNQCLLLHTLVGHTEAVFACDMDELGNIAITGSADRSVRMWDTSTGKQLKSLWPTVTTSIMSVSYSKGYMACSFGKTIVLYRFNQKEKTKLIKTLNEHKNRIEGVQLLIKNPKLPEGIMISAGKDGAIKYWDLSRSKSLHTYRGHEKAINCVSFDETRIASASYDNKIKVWDFSRDKFQRQTNQEGYVFKE